jgi:hypothetical protein
MKRRFDGDRNAQHSLGVGPAFSIIAQNLQVESVPVPFPEHEIEIVVKGKLDALVRTTADETLVLDYKTSGRVSLDASLYEPQLNAYAFALETPRDPRLYARIDGLALLVYRPTDFTYRTERCVSGLYGTTQWIEVTRSQERFTALLKRVADLLSETVQPKPNVRCEFCAHYGAVPVVISTRTWGAAGGAATASSEVDG